MKAKLEFDLTDFDDKLEHLRCVKSTDMAMVLWELQHNSYRTITNGYGDDDSFVKGVDAVFERIQELLDEHDIKPDKLII